jgi:hypothetical protein
MRRLLTAVLLVCSTAGVAKAQIGFQEVRAADGTSYQVIFAPTRWARVLSACASPPSRGSVAGGGACTTPGNVANDPVSAAGGVVSPGMQLYQYDLVRRTSIIVPPNSTITFDSTFGGRLTFGTAGDPAARLVCHAAFDCMGQTGVVEALHPLDFAGDTIPSACIADVDPDCAANDVTTFAFGVTQSGTPPICTLPDEVTVNTTICGPEPKDGFTLNPGEGVVFIYNHSLSMFGFTVDAGGFGISTDTINNPNCPKAPAVVSSSGRTDSEPAPPPPTNTPTSTPTNTPTSTPTNTPTNTATPTNTQTEHLHPDQHSRRTPPRRPPHRPTHRPTRRRTLPRRRTRRRTRHATNTATNTRTSTNTATATTRRPHPHAGEHRHVDQYADQALDSDQHSHGNARWGGDLPDEGLLEDARLPAERLRKGQQLEHHPGGHRCGRRFDPGLWQDADQHRPQRRDVRVGSAVRPGWRNHAIGQPAHRRGVGLRDHQRERGLLRRIDLPEVCRVQRRLRGG